jgi:plasmid stability protein
MEELRRRSVATLNVKNLSDSLYRRLKKRAKQQHRSVAQEVTKILDDALEPPNTLSILTLRGLGKEQWTGLEPAAHVEAERKSWD